MTSLPKIPVSAVHCGNTFEDTRFCGVKLAQLRWQQLLDLICDGLEQPIRTFGDSGDRYVAIPFNSIEIIAASDESFKEAIVRDPRLIEKLPLSIRSDELYAVSIKAIGRVPNSANFSNNSHEFLIWVAQNYSPSCIHAFKYMETDFREELYLLALGANASCIREIPSSHFTQKIADKAIEQDIKNIYHCTNLGQIIPTPEMISKLAREDHRFIAKGKFYGGDYGYLDAISNLNVFPRAVFDFLYNHHTLELITAIKSGAPTAYSLLEESSLMYTNTDYIPGDCPICLTDGTTVRKCNTCSMTICSRCFENIDTESCPGCRSNFLSERKEFIISRGEAHSSNVWLNLLEGLDLKYSISSVNDLMSNNDDRIRQLESDMVRNLMRRNRDEPDEILSIENYSLANLEGNSIASSSDTDTDSDYES